MELNGEAVEKRIFDALAAFVVGVDKGHARLFAEPFADDGVAVILAGDIGARAVDLFYGLIGAAVSVFPPMASAVSW